MLNTDPILTEIILKAIPNEDCPVKQMHVNYRREVAEKRLIAYISEIKKQYEQSSRPENKH